jgi:lipoyl(octanoyl) transferase
VVPYADGLGLQERLVQERQAGRIPDTLLLLQHPHVITVGVRKGGASNIIAASERLTKLGVEVFNSGRGGDVTYHGPGQIVGYPILDLRPDRQDVHHYVRDLEEVMIRTCAGFGVHANRVAGLTGAWVENDKIGAIGVRISHWITSHGFAFNVNTNLEFFNLIVPCGIADRGVTSLAKLSGHNHLLGTVEDVLVRHFLDVFGSTAAEPTVARVALRS